MSFITLNLMALSATPMSITLDSAQVGLISRATGHTPEGGVNVSIVWRDRAILPKLVVMSPTEFDTLELWAMANSIMRATNVGAEQAVFRGTPSEKVEVKEPYNFEPTSQEEFITRGAALAMGINVHGWEWQAEDKRLYKPKSHDAFGPLSRLSDAYRLEDKLRMIVTYLTCGCDKAHRVIRVSTEEIGSVMVAVGDNEESLTARCRAITQFAALWVISDANHEKPKR